jgi:16S rRNA (adenine1518-N6/adenine1519-N6)-dimethyltransferase
MEGVRATEVRSALDLAGRSPSRSLGQNFLVDANVASKIARLAWDEGGQRNVVEIGPGLGSLTVFLAERFETVVAIESDRFLLDPLRVILQSREISNVKIVHGDAMRFDFSPHLGLEGRWMLAANLPYNVASPVIASILEEVPQIDRLVVMVQSEVGERLSADPGSKVYGALSVKVQYYSDAKVVMRVPPSVFRPQPKVQSSVVELRRHDRWTSSMSSVQRDAMFTIVRAAFGHRRQMLRRSLAAFGGDRLLEACSIAPSERPERLTIEQWFSLGSMWSSSEHAG